MRASEGERRTLSCADHSMHIGIIVSMKKGLEQFVYRELVEFTANGASLSLFPTKYQEGLYNAKKEWALYRWHPLIVVLLQPFFFFRAPSLYLQLLREALATKSLVDFTLAWYFSYYMDGVDVIYATFGDRKLYVGYYCKKIIRRPLVVTIHAYEMYQNPNPHFFARALAACDQIITVTSYNREYLAAHYNINPSRVEIVRCSVDTQDYRPQKKFVVLIVGFFVERKGHEVLFRALKQLAREDIEVWVVGDVGAEASVDVKGMASRLGVDSQVAFFGKLSGNALKAMYRACDVFCLPCRTDSGGVAEGFPVVLIEAMAMGKPIISTRHVEIPRVIENLLVDENDVQGLAKAILQVYQSAELRRKLGEKNRQIAEDLFSTRNANMSMDVFHALIARYRDRKTIQRYPERNSENTKRDKRI